MKIPISCFGKEANRIWDFSRNGELFVKTAYYVLKKKVSQELTRKNPSSSSSYPSATWKSIWRLDVPPKIRNFLWRVSNNALATKANLFYRKCSFFALCPICNAQEGSVEHMLFFCDHVAASWFVSPFGFRINPLGFQSFAGRLRSMCNLFSNNPYQLRLG